MKHLIALLSLLCAVAATSFSQSNSTVLQKELPIINISKDLTIHFISPENIQYVDLSTNAIQGDLPIENVLRIKVLPDSADKFRQEPGNVVLTVVGESFIAQYNLSFVSGNIGKSLPTQVNILPEHTSPLSFPGILLTTKDMQALSLRILKQPVRSGIRSTEGTGLKARLNGVYSVGDYIFLDIAYLNRTNLPYEIDEQRFKIEDKKIVKATNAQSIEVKPIWQLYASGFFNRRYRNIYVLKKLTFPGNKVLTVELTEKQLSGRALTLKIPYRDILNADTM